MQSARQILISTEPSQEDWATPRPYGHCGLFYETASRGFAAAFRRLRCTVNELKRPQNYVSPVARKAITTDAIHLTFTPPKGIRLLNGAINIGYFGGDLAPLPTPTSVDPFGDPWRMLSLPLEIWVDSRFTHDMLRRQGIARVHHMPVPFVEEPAISGDGGAASLSQVRWTRLRIGFGRYDHIDGPTTPELWLGDILSSYYSHVRPLVFFVALDEMTSSSELHSVIAGFLDFHGQTSEALLLIQLSPQRNPGGADVSRFLRERPFGFEIADSRGIWLTANPIPAATRAELRRLIDGYICISSLPARNLHLLEYLAGEVTPLGPGLDGLAEHLSADTGIAFDPEAITQRHAIANALRLFAGLGTGRRQSMQRCLRDLIADRHSVESVAARVASRMQQLSTAFRVHG